MPPKADPRYDRAVKLVLDGMTVNKLAWVRVGKPGASEESALRNIRKRVAAARPSEQLPPPEGPRQKKRAVHQGPPPAVTPPPIVRNNGEKVPRRRTSHQVVPYLKRNYILFTSLCRVPARVSLPVDLGLASRVIWRVWRHLAPER